MMEINSDVSPRIKLECSGTMNSFSVNLEVKIVKKEIIDAAEVNLDVEYVFSEKTMCVLFRRFYPCNIVSD